MGRFGGFKEEKADSEWAGVEGETTGRRDGKGCFCGQTMVDQLSG